MEKTPDSDELVPLETLERRAIFRALRPGNIRELENAIERAVALTLYRKLKQYESKRPQA
jgi:DNA-binding NtrC family response regulator